MALELTTWNPAGQMFSTAMRLAAWPEEVSMAPTPPSRAAIFFSTASKVGLARRGVEKAFRLQIEKVAHLLGALVNVSGALHDRGHTGLPFLACSPRGYKGYPA